MKMKFKAWQHVVLVHLLTMLFLPPSCSVLNYTLSVSQCILYVFNISLNVFSLTSFS